MSARRLRNRKGRRQEGLKKNLMQGKHRNKRIFPWVSLKIVTDVLKKQVMWWGDLGQMEWDWGGEGQRMERQRCFSEQSNTLGAERLSAEMRCGESPPERDCYLGSLQSARSVWNAAMELNHWSDADSVAGRTFQMTFNPNENMVSNLERSPKFSNLEINPGLSSSSTWSQCVV